MRGWAATMIVSPGKTALVTGASSGIGEAFARALAARGMSVLLTALPEEETALRALAAELHHAHGVRAASVVLDLSRADAPRMLQRAADDLGFDPDLLVNSAGVGIAGSLAETAADSALNVIRVNVEALVAVTALYLRRMVSRRAGGVINVASVAGLQPLPYSAVYAASKAFVLSFSEALWAENHRYGVRVITVCPGPILTRFYERARPVSATPASLRWFNSVGSALHSITRRSLTTEMVVASALAALEQDHPRVVRRAPGAGAVYGPVFLISRMMPRRLRLLALERFFRPTSAAGI